MTNQELLIWGLFGGFIVEGLDYWRVVRSNCGRCPQGYLTMPLLVAEGIRLTSGAGLAVAFGISGQVSGPIGAIAIGVAAPLIVERMASVMPQLPGESARIPKKGK